MRRVTYINIHYFFEIVFSFDAVVIYWRYVLSLIPEYVKSVSRNFYSVFVRFYSLAPLIEWMNE